MSSLVNHPPQVDTIAAIATAPGRGSVGIVRVSGPEVESIIAKCVKQTLTPRYATYTWFYIDAELIDQGLAIYFPAPHSLTGESVLELQGHGGAVACDRILKSVLAAGARLADPGEFLKRAYLNDKINLLEAEAIAGLVEAQSEASAKAAVHSLQGVFADCVHELNQQLTELRVFVEASLDFSDEDIDVLSHEAFRQRVAQLEERFRQVLAQAQSGRALSEGLRVVLVGEPNVGKSTLLNQLAGFDRAIVTPHAGTTRDIIEETILIDGLPIHIIDTAGLRETHDDIEQMGIERTHESLQRADVVLWLQDVSQDNPALNAVAQLPVSGDTPWLIVQNKCDLVGMPEQRQVKDHRVTLTLSAKQGIGMSLLENELKNLAGLQTEHAHQFLARRRHLDALEQAQALFQKGHRDFVTHTASELFAEDLRRAQGFLNTLTGDFSSDDLLGEIFSSFCIGK